RRRAERQLVAEIAAGREQDGGPIGEPEPGIPEVVTDDGITPDGEVESWLRHPAPVPARAAVAMTTATEAIEPEGTALPPVLATRREALAARAPGSGLWSSF